MGKQPKTKEQLKREKINGEYLGKSGKLKFMNGDTYKDVLFVDINNDKDLFTFLCDDEELPDDIRIQQVIPGHIKEFRHTKDEGAVKHDRANRKRQ